MLRLHDTEITRFVIAAILGLIDNRWTTDAQIAEWNFDDQLKQLWRDGNKIGYIKAIRTYASGAVGNYGMNLSCISLTSPTRYALENANIATVRKTLSLKEAKDIADVVWNTCGNYQA